MDYRKIELAKEAFTQMYQIAQRYREQAQLASQEAEGLRRQVKRLEEQMGQKEETSLEYLKTIANDVGRLCRETEQWSGNQDKFDKFQSGIDERLSQLLMSVHEEIDGLQNVIEHCGKTEREEASGEDAQEKEETGAEREAESSFEGIAEKFE